MKNAKQFDPRQKLTFYYGAMSAMKQSGLFTKDFCFYVNY